MARTANLAQILFGLLLGMSVADREASAPAFAQDKPVPTYHGDVARTGAFVVPALTLERARALRLDTGFQASFSGHVYAQPLYWRDSVSGSELLIVVTEDDSVLALDAGTGKPIWSRALGKPVPLDSLLCGNIDPWGITGTPAIDERGAEGNWPNLQCSRPEPTRSAHDPRRIGVCALPWPLWRLRRLPWVVGISIGNPKLVRAWSTRANGGGIWAPGGISSDGRALYVATGNTMRATNWSDGEAVIRLAPDLRRRNASDDYFAPSDWRSLDDRDADLGGANPLLFDLQRANALQPVVLALGKDRRAYLLDRHWR